MIGFVGCSTLGRRRTQGNAVAAREMTRLGQESMVGKRYDEAETRFAHAVELSPEDVTARRHYAHALWQLGKKAEAIEQLEQAVQMSGGDPHWTVELGNMLLAENQLSQAAQACEQALQIDDQLAAAFVLRANVLLQQGREDEALNDFHRARSLGSAEPEVLYNMAAIYDRKQRPHRVLATLQRLEDWLGASQLDVDAVRLKGTALQSVGRLEEAAETLAVAYQRDPRNQELALQMAECQLASGQVAAARRTLGLAMSLGPLTPHARELMANINNSANESSSMIR